MATLNPEQRAAVEHGDGPLLVLAGAGTGKTRVLVHRIERLVQSGVAPWEILAVTFTNKAAGEMRERVRALLGAGVERMWIGTFHSICARLLRRYGSAIGLPPDFQIFDDDDQTRAINALLKGLGVEDSVSARTIASRFDFAKNRGLDPAEVPGGQPFVDDIVRDLYPQYQARLAREKAVDFGDLILKVLDLGAHADVGPYLQTRFRHVLVDEFQDTNVVQYRLVRMLSHGTGNLTVVGDDDQSIYAWRGAEPRNLLDFDHDFPAVREIKLEQNYRSTSTILEAANAVIGKNLDRRGKSLWTEAGGGDPIGLYAAGDDRGEAEWIGRTLRQMVDDGECSPGDVALLYRTNAQSRALEEQLRRFRFEPKVVGATAFYERKEVKDAIAYLRLVANPDADSAFERVVNVPPRGIGEATVVRLEAHARAQKIGLLAAARDVARGGGELGPGPRKKLSAFVGLIDGLREVHAAGASLAELIIQVVDRSGYRASLEAGGDEGKDRMRNLAELVNVATDFEDERGADAEGDGLAELLERLALVGAADQADGRGETVTLMTIHMAKGLEFDVVFLCGLEDGLFPSMRPRAEMDESVALEEERRLAYVALTRARKRLFLSFARVRRVWGDIKLQSPSRFLDEIPPQCFPVAPRPAPVSRPRVGPPAMAPRSVRAGGASAAAAATSGTSARTTTTCRRSTPTPISSEPPTIRSCPARRSGTACSASAPSSRRAAAASAVAWSSTSPRSAPRPSTPAGSRRPEPPSEARARRRRPGVRTVARSSARGRATAGRGGRRRRGRRRARWGRSRGRGRRPAAGRRGGRRRRRGRDRRRPARRR
jgi:DNA helicase-2/ATP-dependent DNA helicase PcrA